MLVVIVVLGAALSVWLPQPIKGYGVAASVALLIAFVAYPWQKELDRKLQMESESRKAVAELIYALEEFLTVLTNASLVKVDKVPETAEQRIDIQKALSLVRAYGGEEIVKSAIAYDRSLRSYRKCLEKEKPLRKNCEPHPTRPNTVKRTDEYIAAQDERSKVYREMKTQREEFFASAGKMLGVKISTELLADKSEVDENAD